MSQTQLDAPDSKELGNPASADVDPNAVLLSELSKAIATASEITNDLVDKKAITNTQRSSETLIGMAGATTFSLLFILITFYRDWGMLAYAISAVSGSTLGAVLTILFFRGWRSLLLEREIKIANQKVDALYSMVEKFRNYLGSEFRRIKQMEIEGTPKKVLAAEWESYQENRARLSQLENTLVRVTFASRMLSEGMGSPSPKALSPKDMPPLLPPLSSDGHKDK